MAQIKNNTGDIKVMNDKGVIKWFAPLIANNKQLMKSMNYEIVDAPDSFPLTDNSSDNEEPKEKRPYKSRK